MPAILPTPILNLTLGELRNGCGMTTRQAAGKLGISHARVSQIEKEGTNNLDTLEKMAQVYGVSFDIMRAVNKHTRER